MAEMERAFIELERRWRGGAYINLFDGVIVFPKRGGKPRRRKRRKRRNREGSSGSGVHTDPGSSTLSSPSSASDTNTAVHLSSPTSPNSAPGPSTMSLSGSRDTLVNLIDLNIPVSSPVEDINGLMATMNIN